MHINTGTIFHNSHYSSFRLFCVRRPAVPLLLLFKYALSWGASILVQCTTVNVTVLIATSDKHTKFSKLNNKSTESDQQQLH